MQIKLSYPDLIGSTETVSTVAMEDLAILLDEQTIPVHTVEKALLNKGSAHNTKVIGLDIDVIVNGSGQCDTIRTVKILQIEDSPTKFIRRSWSKPRDDEDQPRWGEIDIPTRFPIGQRIKTSEPGLFVIDKITLELRNAAGKGLEANIIYGLLHQIGDRHRPRCVTEDELSTLEGQVASSPIKEGPSLVKKPDVADYVIYRPKGEAAAWTVNQRAITQRLKGLKGTELETEVALILQESGIIAHRRSNASSHRNDGGADVMASKGDLFYIIQCKGYPDRSPPPSEIDKCVGSASNFERKNLRGIMLLTTGPTSENLSNKARDQKITLIGGDQLDGFVTAVMHALEQT